MFAFWKKKDGEGKGKRIGLLVPAILVGIALILLGGLSPQKKEETPTGYDPAKDEIAQYQHYLEERVVNLCQSVAGVDHVTAVVTLSGSFERVYATELSKNGEEYVVLGSGSTASALPLYRAVPSVSGIGIVCRGGSNAAVRQELLSLICAAFHVTSNRVYITEAGAR